MLERFWRRVAGLTGWRGVLAALGFGALAALALPPLHGVPVLWIALPGLLALLGSARSWRRAMVLGFAWGWGFFAAGLYWVTYALLTDVSQFWWLVPIAVPALALPLSLFVAGPALAAWWAAPGWPRLLVFAGAWVAFELLRGWAFTGFPWNLLGTVWAFAALPVQAAAWIGVHGLSLVTLLACCAPSVGRRATCGGLVAMAMLGAFGLARLAPQDGPPQPVSLLIVQGNIAQEMKWRGDQRAAILGRYIEMTRQSASLAARDLPEGQSLVVVWPETAVPYLVASDRQVRALIAAALPPDAVLLTGSVRAEFGPDGRVQRVFNSVVAMDSRGEVLSVSDKVHLVPFGEYMPLSNLLPIRIVQGGMDFTPGARLEPGRAGALPPWGPLVCYEVIFPAQVVPAERPRWLVNVTNDAWFGVSAGPWQHLAAARLRAVEEGLPLVRAAQTGVSAVFDSRGRTVARLGLAEAGVVRAPLPAVAAPTPFSRLGLWIPGVLSAFVLILGGLCCRVRRINE